MNQIEADIAYQQKQNIEKQPMTDFIEGTIEDQIEFFGSNKMMVLTFITMILIVLIGGDVLRNKTPDVVDVPAPHPIVSIQESQQPLVLSYHGPEPKNAEESIKLMSLIISTEMAVKSLKNQK